MADGELTLKLNDETVRRLEEAATAAGQSVGDYAATLIAQAAHLDFERLPAFLAPESVKAARRCREVLLSAVNSLAELPERGRSGPLTDLRELSVPFGRSGYVIQYRTGHTTVVIARIFHAREGR